MEIRTALTLEIGHLDQPVVTSYQIGLVIFRLYRAKRYKGEDLSRIQKDYPNKTDFNRLLKELLTAGVLQPSASARHAEVFSILGKEQASSEEIACCIDPFAYLSHLSAMEYHGFTDRIPKILFISSPPSARWSQFASERMGKDLGDDLETYLDAGLPPLRRLGVNKINKQTVNRYSSVHLGAFISVKGKALRVSTIGRTFLDMIREPDLCGGIYHVLDIYQEHAERYLQLIVDEIDRHGTPIDKVRAGYILEERCGLSHPVLDRWRALVQRGGSRRLYAHHEYSPHYSPRWCLSVNIEE